VNRAITAIAAAALLAQTPAVRAEDKSLTFKARSMGEIDDTQATKAGFRSPVFGYAHFGFTNFKASNGEPLMVLYTATSETQKKRSIVSIGSWGAHSKSFHGQRKQTRKI
jgi:hypothetical protein